MSDTQCYIEVTVTDNEGRSIRTSFPTGGWEDLWRKCGKHARTFLVVAFPWIPDSLFRERYTEVTISADKKGCFEADFPTVQWEFLFTEASIEVEGTSVPLCLGLVSIDLPIDGFSGVASKDWDSHTDQFCAENREQEYNGGSSYYSEEEKVILFGEMRSKSKYGTGHS